MGESTMQKWVIHKLISFLVCTVTSCAVSADGERIYVVNWKQRQLVTLTRDGNVVSTRKNRALRWGNLVVLPGLHVMDSGQVLICGMESHTILQVDRDGQQRMAAVVTEEDGVHWPISVYYRKNKELLIVGMKDNDNIMLFDKEPLIEELSWSFNKQKT
ncbi:hypothetical protein DPMN_117425 [Dreissena polymorpha]|uniref:Uncharacterized protein n=1 Tax=Dreissena polymorpha TaxID=45954 RepID=A0A9D4KQC7_DREPO|nr:hypothetical protein DPMN_117425 [Dreissena polymorpha]